MPCPGDHYSCYRDCCRDDQFCNDHEQRCTGCGTLDQLCGTLQMPVQCKYYCFVKNANQTPADPLANPALAIAGIVCMAVLAGLVAFILYGIIKRRQWLTSCFRVGHIMPFRQTSHRLPCAETVDPPVHMSCVTVTDGGADVSLNSVPSKYRSSGADTNDVDKANQPLLKMSDGCHSLSATHVVYIGKEKATSVASPPATAPRSRSSSADTSTLGVTTHTGSKDSLPSVSLPESDNGNARDVHEVSRRDAVPMVVRTGPALQRAVTGGGNDNERRNFGGPGESSSGDIAYCPEQANVQNAPPGPYHGNVNLHGNGTTAGYGQHHHPAEHNTRIAEERPHDYHVGANPNTTITIHNNVNNFIDHNTPSPGHRMAANTPTPHIPGTEAFHSPSPPPSHCGPQGPGAFSPGASGPQTPHDQGYGRCEGHHTEECRDKRLNGISPTQPAPGEENGVVTFAIDQNSVPPNYRLEQPRGPSNE